MSMLTLLSVNRIPRTARILPLKERGNLPEVTFSFILKSFRKPVQYAFSWNSARATEQLH